MGAGSGGFYVAQQMMKQATAASRSTFKPDSLTHQVLFFALACLLAVLLGRFGTLVGGFLIFIVFYVEIRAMALVMPARWHARKWLMLGGAVLLSVLIWAGARSYLYARFPVERYARHGQMPSMTPEQMLLYHQQRSSYTVDMRNNGAASAVAFLVLFGSLAWIHRPLAWPVEVRSEEVDT